MIIFLTVPVLPNIFLTRLVYESISSARSFILPDNIIYFILSSEINVSQKWIKVIFSLKN